ncbi:MAG: TonB-dependent receptor [Nibricoccus sp.]
MNTSSIRTSCILLLAAVAPIAFSTPGIAATETKPAQPAAATAPAKPAPAPAAAPATKPSEPAKSAAVQAPAPAAKPAPAPAAAQKPAETPKPLPPETSPTAAAGDEVLVMDTVYAFGRFNEERTVLSSAVPIDSLTSNELRSTGYTETSQALQALVPSFNFPRPSLTDGTDHIRPASLRGLAPDQTLILVNGKRRHPSALINVNGTSGAMGRGSASVDFNAFPPTAIGGVEVLRDGAAAQYGSDAIAGVIDLKLRSDIGRSLSATVGSTYEGDGNILELAFDAGAKLGETGFIHASTYFRDREKTNRTGTDFRQQYFGFNSSGQPVVFPTVNTTTDNHPVPPAGATFDPREATVNRHSSRLGDADSKEYGIFINSEVGKNVKGYAFGGYTHRDSSAAANFRRPLDNSNVRSIFPDGFLPLIKAKVTDSSITGGVKDLTGDWTWDLSQTWGSNELKYDVDNTVNATLGNASPTRFYAGKLFFQQATTNLDLTHQFDFGWNAPLRLALGSEYRWENYKITEGEPDSYRNGGVRILDGPFANSATTLPVPGAQGFPGFQPADRVNPKRNNYAFYCDVENQVTDKIYLSAAGRYENYSDFGSTLNGKVSGRWQVAKPFAVRGSASSGFRAPSLHQSYYSQTATSFISGVPYDIRTFPVNHPVARLLGSVDLKPEKSQNYSAGGILQLGNTFSATVDLYEIIIHDRISYSSNFNDASVRTFLAAQGFPGVGGARYFTNAINTKTHGIDLTMRYLITTKTAGNLILTAGINSNRQKLTRVAETPPQLAAISTVPLIDRVETVRYEKGQPRDTINLAANYRLKKWNLVVREVRYGKASLAGNANDVTRDQTVSAKWLTDINLAYDFRRYLSFNLGANNVFDVYPDRVLPTNNPSGFVKYPNVSPFGYSGGFYYLRLNSQF